MSGNSWLVLMFQLFIIKMYNLTYLISGFLPSGSVTMALTLFLKLVLVYIFNLGPGSANFTSLYSILCFISFVSAFISCSSFYKIP